MLYQTHIHHLCTPSLRLYMIACMHPFHMHTISVLFFGFVDINFVVRQLVCWQKSFVKILCVHNLCVHACQAHAHQVKTKNSEETGIWSNAMLEPKKMHIDLNAFKCLSHWCILGARVHTLHMMLFKRKTNQTKPTSAITYVCVLVLVHVSYRLLLDASLLLLLLIWVDEWTQMNATYILWMQFSSLYDVYSLWNMFLCVWIFVRWFGVFFFSNTFSLLIFSASVFRSPLSSGIYSSCLELLAYNLVFSLSSSLSLPASPPTWFSCSL